MTREQAIKAIADILLAHSGACPFFFRVETSSGGNGWKVYGIKESNTGQIVLKTQEQVNAFILLADTLR